VPKVVGLRLAKAQNKLKKLDLDPRVSSFAAGKPGRVLAQTPRAGVAAAANMPVRLVVGRA